MAYFGMVDLTAILQLGLEFEQRWAQQQWFRRRFLVQVRLFVLILLYNCFLYELLMQEVRIFEKFARRLPADSTENCKLSKRLEFYV